MIDESINNPRDLEGESFTRLEEQVVDISHNTNLLMVALTNNIRVEEYKGSNLEVISKGKSWD